MARWMKPTEELPEAEAGDRVLVIVMERLHRNDKNLTPRLVTLEAREDGGWDSIEDTYAGYTPHDGILWSMEKDVCQIASILDFEPKD